MTFLKQSISPNEYLLGLALAASITSAVVLSMAGFPTEMPLITLVHVVFALFFGGFFGRILAKFAPTLWAHLLLLLAFPVLKFFVFQSQLWGANTHALGKPFWAAYGSAISLYGLETAFAATILITLMKLKGPHS